MAKRSRSPTENPQAATVRAKTLHSKKKVAEQMEKYQVFLKTDHRTTKVLANKVQTKIISP